MKKKPEYVEGRKAFQNFENALGTVMKVPHSEIKAQLEAKKREKRNRPLVAQVGKETHSDEKPAK